MMEQFLTALDHPLDDNARDECIENLNTDVI